MSKNTINIFNVSIYQELLKKYDYSFSQLKKYFKIYCKMKGYYTSKEIHYIIGVYHQELIEIINSNLFDLFVPKEVKNEIIGYINIIKSLYLQKKYEQVINQYEKIKSMFFIKINP